MTTLTMTGPAIALTKCFFCGEGSEILIQTHNLQTKSRHVEALNGMVTSMRPCSKCEGYMKQGIILLTIDEAKSESGWNMPPKQCGRCGGDGKEPVASWNKCKACGGDGRPHGWIPNPYRMGGFAVVKDNAVERMLAGNKPMLDFAKSRRWIFIEHASAVKLGIFNAAAQA
jgi:hypothetical protein